MSSFHVRIEIEPLEGGGYLADCPAIQGCYAEGKTVGDALDNLRDVARVIYELCQEKGLVFVTDHADITFNELTFDVEIPAVRAVA